MKNCFSFLCCILLITGILACKNTPQAAQSNSFTPGTYTTTVQGRNGPIAVEVTFNSTSILNARVTKHQETAYVGTVPIERMPAALVADQHLTIDTVSGATQTSAALRTALLECITNAGGNVNAISAPVAPAPVKNTVEECDVVIVGGGGSGMSTAAELKRLGLNVILLEKMDILGGTTAFASTYISGYGTSVHRRHNVNYTKADFLATNSETGGFPPKIFRTTYPDATNAFADLIPETCELLMQNGADLSRLIDGRSSLGPADGGTIGSQLVPAIIKIMDSLKVDYRLGSKVISLIEENGTARGVIVETKGGRYEIHSKVVVMAFGGYLQNFEMVAQYTPQYANYGTTYSVGSTGEGLEMCIDLGAYLGGMDSMVINPTSYSGLGKRSMISFTPLRANGGILIAQSTGQRFANEDGEYTSVALAMPDGKGYIIMDQSLYDGVSTIQEYYQYGFIVKGNTPEELAEKINLPPAVLRATIDTYAASAEAGVDEEFGRRLMLAKFSSGPFYATPVEPANHSSVGGVVVNGRGQALRRDGSIINGLYVIGVAADNTMAPSSMTGCFVYSRVVARYLAEDIRGERTSRN
jgi:fumarate reductase flavoprotein subunit